MALRGPCAPPSGAAMLTGMIERLITPAAARAWVRDAQARGARVGLVPTMGALHEGHLSLVRAARDDALRAVASVFVNPTQFGPGEDLARYPRDLEGDLAKLEAAGAEAVFTPTVEAMYPPGSVVTVDPGALGQTLEGAIRPTHFRGVATVVQKLLGVLPADRAFFGQKDYQQTVVVRRMVADLNTPIEIVVCPTVREGDGLAMSSRNAYLSPEARARATCLWRALQAVAQRVAEGGRDRDALVALGAEVVTATPGVELQYLELVRDGTIDPVTTIDGPTVAVIAARVGATRLIDNLRVT